MSMCDRLKGFANFDEAMFLLERRQSGFNREPGIAGFADFQNSKNSSQPTKGGGSPSGGPDTPYPSESVTSLAARLSP